MNKNIPNTYIQKENGTYNLSWQVYLKHFEKIKDTAFYYKIARDNLKKIVDEKLEEKEEKDYEEILKLGAIIKDMSQLEDMVDNILAEDDNQELSQRSEKLLSEFILGVHQYAELDENLEKQHQQLKKFIRDLLNIFKDIENADFNFEEALRNLLDDKSFQLRNGETLSNSFKTFVKRLKELDKRLQENSEYYTANNGNIIKMFYDIAKDKGKEKGIEYIKELYNEKIISEKQKTNIIAVLNEEKDKKELKWGSIAQYFNSIYNQIKGEFFEICELQVLFQMINNIDENARKELIEVVHSGGTNTQGQSDIMVVALQCMNEKEREIYNEKTQTDKAKFVRNLGIPYIGFNIKSFPKPKYGGKHATETLTTLQFTEWIKGQQAIHGGGWNLIHAMQLGFPTDRGDDIEFINAINAAITSAHIEKIYGLHDKVRYIRFSDGIHNIYDYLRGLTEENMYPIFFLKTSSTFRTEKDLMSSNASIVLHDKK